MINRTLVRVKVVQLVYANMMQEGKNLDAAEKELNFSINKSLELTRVLLQLMIDVTDYQEGRLEQAKQKNLPTAEDLSPNTKFIDNRFVLQLKDNVDFQEFQKPVSTIWHVNEDFLRRFTLFILDTPEYKEYMSSDDSSYDEDKAFWTSLYKKYFVNNDDLLEVLEENSVYWNDDMFIVGTFVQKLIRQSKEGEEGFAGTILLKYKNDEDIEFGKLLFRRVLLDQTYYKELIEACAVNWEIDRVALMDTVIMMCALAELIEFPQIPVKVTLNEYIELAKIYSTPKSGTFVNGILDNALKILRKEGKIAITKQ